MMKIINKAQEEAKNQPELYLYSLNISLANMNKNADKKNMNKIKHLRQIIKKRQQMDKSEASLLLVIMSTNKVKKHTEKKFSEKLLQKAMLYLVLIIYKDSSFVSKFLMRSYIKQGLNRLLK